MSHILEDTLEIERLVLVTIQLIDAKECSEDTLQEALPKAYRLIELIKAFLTEKQKEREAEAERYWKSEEGKKRRAEVEARFNTLRDERGKNHPGMIEMELPVRSHGR